MFLRDNQITVTDFDLMVFMYKSDRRISELSDFLSANSQKNAHTYLGRLKQKGYVKKKSASNYELTPKGRELIETLKSELNASA